MSNEPNKLIKAEELTERELEGIEGGKDNMGGSGPEIQGGMEFSTNFNFNSNPGK